MEIVTNVNNDVFNQLQKNNNATAIHSVSDLLQPIDDPEKIYIVDLDCFTEAELQTLVKHAKNELFKPATLLYVTKIDKETLLKERMFQKQCTFVPGVRKIFPLKNNQPHETENAPFLHENYCHFTDIQKDTFKTSVQKTPNISLFFLLLNLTSQKIKSLVTIFSIIEKSQLMKEEYFQPNTKIRLKFVAKHRRNKKKLKQQSNVYKMNRNIFENLFEDFGWLEMKAFDFKFVKRKRKSCYVYFDKIKYDFMVDTMDLGKPSNRKSPEF